MTKTVLITGAAGFIGSHVAAHFLQNTDYHLIFLDRLDCSGNLNRLTQMNRWNDYRSRCKWVYHDLRAPISSLLSGQIGHVDFILHLAAATHVDRSIEDPLSFVYDNVVATCNILEYAHHRVIERMVYFSTDEVFGPAARNVSHSEWDNYNSGNPYAATKAGGEELCLAFANTYKVPVFITHTMNVFGQRQHPEKFIPSTIKKVLTSEMVTIHSDSTRTTAGSRFYIHARNVAAALLFLLERGKVGEKYNIVGEREVDNLSLAMMIANVVGRQLNYEMIDFHSSRPGHDLRYALDGSLMRSMGWRLPIDFTSSLQTTIEWTLANREWLGEPL